MLLDRDALVGDFVSLAARRGLALAMGDLTQGRQLAPHRTHALPGEGAQFTCSPCPQARRAVPGRSPSRAEGWQGWTAQQHAFPITALTRGMLPARSLRGSVRHPRRGRF